MTRRWPRLPAPPLSPGRTRQGHRGRRPGPPARFPSPALAPIRALPPAGAARTPDAGGRRSEVGGRRPAAARSEQGQQGRRRGNAPGRPQLAAPPPGARILTSAAPRTGCGRDALKRQEAPSRVKAGPLSAEEPAGAGRPSQAGGRAARALRSGASPAHRKTRWPRGRTRNWLQRSRAAS